MATHPHIETSSITRTLQSVCSLICHVSITFLVCSTICSPVVSTDGEADTCAAICSYKDAVLSADCSGLDLTRIPTKAGLCSRATTVDFQYNNIQVVQQTDLAEYTSVQVLVIGHNDINNISVNMFGNLNNLEQLQLNQNNIRSVSNEAFRGLNGLTALHLDNNVIEELQSAAFDGLRSLEKLYLSENRISVIPQGVFRDLGKVSLLNMNNNKIGSLSGQSFTGLTQLSRLILENNALTSVDMLVFQDLPLKQMYLVNNNITTLSNVNTFLDQATNLKTLDLSGNPLHCGCAIDPLRTWLRAKGSDDGSMCATPAEFKGIKVVDITQNLCDYNGPVDGLTSPKSLETTQQEPEVGRGTGGNQRINSDNTWKIVIIVCVGFLVIAILVGSLVFIGRRRGGNFHLPQQPPKPIHYSSVQIGHPFRGDHHRTRMSSENSETQLMGHSDAYESYTIPPDARANQQIFGHQQANGRPLRGDHRAPLVKQSSTGSATTSPDIAIADSSRDEFILPDRPGERPARFSISEPAIPEVELEFDSDGNCTSFGDKQTSAPPLHPPPPPPPSMYHNVNTPLGTNTGYLALPNLQKV